MAKVFLTILDGWGVREEQEWNAIAHADTKNFDYLNKEYPLTSLTACGEAVGLPDGQMGNSEVGHLNIGAGRVVETGLYRINQAIKLGEFEHLENVQKVFEGLKSNLHVMILASRGGVHSHISHLYAFLEVAKASGVKPFVHLFGDGRDVAPKQFLTDLEEIEEKIKESGAVLASISGRYYAMDRDKNWDRLEKVLKVLVKDGELVSFKDAREYVNSEYEKGTTDEFIIPAISEEYLSSGELNGGDVVVFLNFRPDRAKQISHLLVPSEKLYSYKSELTPKNLSLYTMVDYEGVSATGVFFPAIKLENTLGEVINSVGKAQLRAAESEKYPHVTYFFDGGVEKKFERTDRVIVPSPKVGTYDKAPEMSIHQLYEEIESKVKTTDYDLVVVNLANPDMVGHSGDFEATVKACSAVDLVLGKIYQLTKEKGYTLVVMADHGNADIMRDEKGEPHTAHTLSPVPFIVCNKEVVLKNGGKLGDVSPTILELLSIEKPAEMTGESLLLAN
ncbi:phosphoglyceromutase [Mycoplasma wenyonii str. Massachusetts]|uniref:2,3-bisphosphoglycerate-independent phosphoglycerate mutase n=1 Tax=Mycoplasma wenyonii (strain Massachusetts) TaxID=1197325 RepID=I6ZEH5_MYCWM|nr:2,3-bisphosphoglycerate-independent phosphoglycerate mutase [Mycoplasma wenyonii]AFN64992.1 phosphoglyceromutase [Mycoplasma wenyonii str. Massachusetts]